MSQSPRGAMRCSSSLHIILSSAILSPPPPLGRAPTPTQPKKGSPADKERSPEPLHIGLYTPNRTQRGRPEVVRGERRGVREGHERRLLIALSRSAYKHSEWLLKLPTKTRPFAPTHYHLYYNTIAGQRSRFAKRQLRAFYSVLFTRATENLQSAPSLQSQSSISTVQEETIVTLATLITAS
jgi:hypothetical protein